MQADDRGKIHSLPVVFFDLGNTLLYYQGDRIAIELAAYEALAQSLSSTIVSFPQKKFLKRFQFRMQQYYRRREETLIEETTLQQLAEVLDGLGYSQVPHLTLRKALDCMYQVTEPHWQLDPETVQSLSRLKSLGCKIGLISNASDAPNVFRLLRLHQIYSYFTVILISSVIGYRKPHTEIFSAALKSFPNAVKENTYMVGDLYATDIRGGQQLGLQTIWLSKHAECLEDQESEPITQPDLIFPSLEHLAIWMEQTYQS